MQVLRFRWFWYAVGLAIFGFIAIASLLPQVPMPIIFSWSDKLIHAAAYFCMVAYVGNLLLSRYILPMVIGVFLFSIAIEVIQPFTGRHFDRYDMLANATGCVLAIIFLYAGGNQWLRNLLVITHLQARH